MKDHLQVLKAKVTSAHTRFSKKTQKITRALTSTFKAKRALFGEDAIIIIAFFTATMGILYLAAPVIMSTLFNAIIGGPNGIYSYLLELPLLASTPSKGATMGQQLGTPMVRIFSLMQNVSLAMFSVVLLTAGICYVLENFRIMNEGTASNIIMNSVFTLVLIFACQPIYNAAAAAVNSFVGWPSVGGSGLIIPSGNALTTLVGFATGGKGTVPLPNLDPFTGFFFTAILIMLTASILMMTLVMGVVRLFFVGVLAAVMPLILVLRLIPFTKHLADTLLQDLVGFMFASIMASIVLLFGYTVLTTSSFGALTQIIVAIVTLFAAAYMSTVFVGKFGALGMSAANLVGGAITSAFGSGMGVATGAMIGGAGGAAGMFNQLKRTGLAGGAMSKHVLMGFGRGAGMGATTSLMFSDKGPTFSFMGKSLMGGVKAQKMPGEAYLSNRAGSTLNAVVDQNSAADVLPSSTHEAGSVFQAGLAKKPNDDVFREYVGKNYPELAAHIKDKSAAGYEVKKHLLSLPSAVALSNWGRAIDHGKLGGKERSAVYENARVNNGPNKEKVQGMVGGVYEPNLHSLDESPRFAIDTFNTGTVTEKGTVANAKLFEGMKQLGAQKPRQTRHIRNDFTKEAYENLKEAKPEALGKQISQAAGVKMTPKEQMTYGHAMKKITGTMNKRNKAFVQSMSHYVSGGGQKKFAELMKNQSFTEQAVRNMHSHETSAWLHNNLNLKAESRIRKGTTKRAEEISAEKLLKVKTTAGKPETSITRAPHPAYQTIKKRGEQIDLLEMQRRALEEN